MALSAESTFRARMLRSCGEMEWMVGSGEKRAAFPGSRLVHVCAKRVLLLRRREFRVLQSHSQHVCAHTRTRAASGLTAPSNSHTHGVVTLLSIAMLTETVTRPRIESHLADPYYGAGGATARVVTQGETSFRQGRVFRAEACWATLECEDRVCAR